MALTEAPPVQGDQAEKSITEQMQAEVRRLEDTSGPATKEQIALYIELMLRKRRDIDFEGLLGVTFDQMKDVLNELTRQAPAKDAAATLAEAFEAKRRAAGIAP